MPIGPSGRLTYRMTTPLPSPELPSDVFVPNQSCDPTPVSRTATTGRRRRLSSATSHRRREHPAQGGHQAISRVLARLPQAPRTPPSPVTDGTRTGATRTGATNNYNEQNPNENGWVENGCVENGGARRGASRTDASRTAASTSRGPG